MRRFHIVVRSWLLDEALDEIGDVADAHLVEPESADRRKDVEAEAGLVVIGDDDALLAPGLEPHFGPPRDGERSLARAMSDFKSRGASRHLPKGLTLAQVAFQLGVSRATVHRMRRNSELHPECDANGIWWYQPADVVRAAIRRGSRPRSPSELAAAAFQMFDQGATLREIVVALQMAPEDVRRLCAEFTTPPFTTPRP